jgi:hypothetical protein
LQKIQRTFWELESHLFFYREHEIYYLLQTTALGMQDLLAAGFSLTRDGGGGGAAALNSLIHFLAAALFSPN